MFVASNLKLKARNTNLIASRLNSDTKSPTNSGLCNLLHIVAGMLSTRKNLRCLEVLRISDEWNRVGASLENVKKVGDSRSCWCAGYSERG